MNTTERAALHQNSTDHERTLAMVDHKRQTKTVRRRGWLVRRTLLLADVAGLTAAFLVTELAFGAGAGLGNEFSPLGESLLFLFAVPLWVLVAKLYGLYEHDEERTDHSTVDDFAGVFHMLTVGTWLLLAGAWLTNAVAPDMRKLLLFWALAIGFVALGRALARAFCRRRIAYLQNTVIVGAGDIGQLVARKLLRHPEYGIHVVGFVDADPKALNADLEHVAILGAPKQLPALIERFDVERVIIAFSNDPQEESLELVRSLKRLDVQVDIVPRLFEVVGPRVGIHQVEGLPLVGLPPAKLPRSSRLIKRAVDLIGAVVGLLFTAPLFAYAAWRIKRESAGPVFFRQQRLGLNMQEFPALKFRTMRIDVDDGPHRDLIARIMDLNAAPGKEGLYKLEAGEGVTPFGRWLRKTSLDELPQLINVLRGEMSLVGPRPCIPYEVDHFDPHHFERFLVPAGITGLWQVTARAQSTFREALDMDAAYVRSWSLKLDLWLLLRTPFQVLARRSTA